MFSRDADFLAIAVARQRAGVNFVGVVYAHQLNVSVGRCIEDLEVVAGACAADELRNDIRYLPIRWGGSQ